MATGVNFDILDFRPFVNQIVSVEGTANTITMRLVSNPAQVLALNGAFSYLGDTLTGGFVSSVSLSQNGSPLFSMSIAKDVLALFNEVSGLAPAAFLENLLSGFNGISGSSLSDLIRGYGGGDSINVGAGDDTVFGGLGDDQIFGLAGQDYLRGDEGNDTLYGGDDFDDINGNTGADLAYGEGGDDWVVGGKDDDRLYGDAGNDIVYGNIGADQCFGGAGNDIVRGGKDDDLVEGGEGDDWLSGDRGVDTLTGGHGADRFHTFAGAGTDTVTDFSYAEGDRIVLLPGATYAVVQQALGAFIDLGNGDGLFLRGLDASTVTADWFV